jgi:hypothetical protein
VPRGGGGGHIGRDDVRFSEKNPPAHRNKPRQTKFRSRCPKQQKNKPQIPNSGSRGHVLGLHAARICGVLGRIPDPVALGGREKKTRNHYSTFDTKLCRLVLAKKPLNRTKHTLLGFPGWRPGRQPWWSAARRGWPWRMIR